MKKMLMIMLMLTTVSVFAENTSQFRYQIPQLDRITNQDFDNDGIKDSDDSTPFGNRGESVVEDNDPSPNQGNTIGNITWGTSYTSPYPGFAETSSEFLISPGVAFYPYWSRENGYGVGSEGVWGNTDFKILYLGDCGGFLCIEYKASKNKYTSADDALLNISVVIDGVQINGSHFGTTWYASSENDEHYFGAKYGTHPISVGGNYVEGGVSEVQVLFNGN